jgi:DNA-3-methyladenine glycosylase
VLSGSVHEVARGLLGCTFLRDGVGGRIVEVEAYAPTDPASHAYRGLTRRNSSMFAPAGTLYVYRSYGIHWCVNVVCEPEGTAAAVLLRALEPTRGLAEMRARRGIRDDRVLCSGPGRLTQALGISGADDGLSAMAPPFELESRKRPVDVVATSRIGITKAAELPWRYLIRGTHWASRGPRSG